MVPFTWNVPPIFEGARAQPYYSVVSVDFHIMKDSQVRITLTNTYNKKIDNLEEIINYFDKAWDYVLDGFVKAVSKQTP